MTRRTDRLGHLIQRELGEKIQKDVRDSRIGFVTVSRVDVTSDLSLARVYVTVFGSEKEQRDSLIGLNHSAPFLRTHLSKVLKTRTVPKLEFLVDKNLEHGFRIDEMLRRIGEEEKERKEGKSPSGSSGSGEE